MSSLKDHLNKLHDAIEDVAKRILMNVSPAVERHQKNTGINAQKGGVHFLEVKNTLMLSYLMDLALLLRLKVSSQQTNSHAAMSSCIERLNEMRVLFERIRPMEKKMRHQLDKLLVLSTQNFAAQSENDCSQEKANFSSPAIHGRDPLSYKPNPEHLMTRQHSNNYSQHDTDDESDDSNMNYGGANENKVTVSTSTERQSKESRKSIRKTFNENGSQSNLSNLYKPPRLAAIPFPAKQPQDEKLARIQDKERERMKKSELLQAIKIQFGDKPEEDDFHGGANVGKQREAARRLADKDAEKVKFEEDNMIRLSTTRKEKKIRAKIIREEFSNLRAIADVGNLASGVSAAFESKAKSRRSNSLMDGQLSDTFERKKRRKIGAKNEFQKALYGVVDNNNKGKRVK